MAENLGSAKDDDLDDAADQNNADIDVMFKMMLMMMMMMMMIPDDADDDKDDDGDDEDDDDDDDDDVHDVLPLCGDLPAGCA
jgi:hypothetical protein